MLSVRKGWWCRMQVQYKFRFIHWIHPNISNLLFIQLEYYNAKVLSRPLWTKWTIFHEISCRFAIWRSKIFMSYLVQCGITNVAWDQLDRGRHCRRSCCIKRLMDLMTAHINRNGHENLYMCLFIQLISSWNISIVQGLWLWGEYETHSTLDMGLAIL